MIIIKNWQFCIENALFFFTPWMAVNIIFVTKLLKRLEWEIYLLDKNAERKNTGMTLHISLSYNLIFKAIYTCQLISIYDCVCDDDPYIVTWNPEKTETKHKTSGKTIHEL